eukprot:g267.t1
MLNAARREIRRIPRRYQRVLAVRSREYNFASAQFDSCFGNLPSVDANALREEAVAALKAHEADPSLWFEDPVVTILKGDTLNDGRAEKTVDAFGNENGSIVMATDEEVAQIVEHLKSFKCSDDCRDAVRAIEAVMLSSRAGALIANQAADFKKQDGVTEIEESIEANVIEQRMNDQLLEDERAGKVVISRAPVFVGCVSNFSNFLDLCRKTLRHLELGIPCVVLSRPNTTQHMYRWTQMLLELMSEHNLDHGLLTYASCTISQTQALFDAFPNGAMHITCSRKVAADVRSYHANTLSSTGGPNTLVAAEATPEVLEAIRLSAMIENSGQCTALRHAVVNTDESAIRRTFEDSKSIASPSESLACGGFAEVFENYPFETVDGYTIHKPSHGEPCAFRMSEELPPDDLNEQWRQVYVDVTTPTSPVGSDMDFVDDVASWLVRNQPISLAVNADGYDMALRLFERTGQVVYTVGDTKDHVALTAQARPQDGEVFGEFPVRRDLFKYTKYPMIVPSPPAAYNSTYDRAYLVQQDANASEDVMRGDAAVLTNTVESSAVRGYMHVVADYLKDACGCKTGWRFGDGVHRTALYGIQRPPLNGQMTVVRCDESTLLENVAPILLPFVLTNASGQVRVSCDPENDAVITALEKTGVDVITQTQSQFGANESAEGSNWYNCIRPGDVSIHDDGVFPLAGQFVSLWFPMGHIKSTKPNDQEFLDAFSKSKKWLKVL